MADINNLRDQAKAWLSQMFIPKDVSLEGLQNTGLGQAVNSVTGPMQMAAQPGMLPAAYALSKFFESNAGKQVQTMLDANGPLGGGLDDVIVGGAKALPTSMAVVAPMIANLGRMKPRGVPAKPSEWFHSNLAEAVDKEFIAPGKPEDLLSVKQVRAWLNKLPGMGVKKEEIKHFDLANQLDEIAKDGPAVRNDFNAVPGKMTRQELADLIDYKMPRIEDKPEVRGKYGVSDANKYANYTLPGGENYQNILLHSPDTFKAEKVKVDGVNQLPMNHPLVKAYEDDLQELAQNQQALDYNSPEWDEANYAMQQLRQAYDEEARQLPPQALNVHVNSPFSYGRGDPDHWTSPNVLMHIRTKDRVLPNGKKALYAEEIQSQSQQAAPESYPLTADYESLAHKYLYRKAAEEGYDSVAWAPGSVHIDRWQGYKKPQTPVNSIDDLAEFRGDTEAGRLYTKYMQELGDKRYNWLKNNPGSNDEGAYLIDVVEPLKAKYKQMLIDSGFTKPHVDERFSGFETFYNKRNVQAANSMLKRKGGGQVSETGINNDTAWTESPGDPITGPFGILTNYKYHHPSYEGYIHPAPHQSFTYDIRPEDKAKGALDYKTDPLWMLLGGLGISRLMGTKTNGGKPD